MKSDKCISVLNCVLVILVFGMAAFLRFAGLYNQGFSDSDEFAAYQFLTGSFQEYILEGTSGSMWARPFGFLLNYISFQIFGELPHSILIKNAILGFVTIIIIYKIGEKYLGRNSGLFASTIMSGLFSLVYYSKNMKFIAPSLFFCSLSLWFLFSLWRSHKRSDFLLCGLFAGLMVTTHPNTLPMAAVLLSLSLIGAVVFFLKKKDFRVFFLGFWTGIGFFIPLIVCELFFICLRLFFPFWVVHPDVGYIQNLIFHANLELYDPPSLWFYLKAIARNGYIFLVLCIGSGCLLLFQPERFKNYGFILLAVFWGPILIYTLSPNITAVERNIMVCLIPASLLGGDTLAQGIRWVGSKQSHLTKTIMLSVVFLAVLAQGLLQSSKLIQNQSIAQQIWNYIEVGRASISRPNRSVYSWEQYYFQDRSLSCDNWEDVFRNYLSRQGEYLVLLNQTDATLISDAPVALISWFKRLNSYGLEEQNGILDLKDLHGFFKERYGFNEVFRPYPMLNVPVVWREQHELIDKFRTMDNHFEFLIPKDADLLMISGRVALHSEANEMVVLALGNADRSYEYDLRFFQAAQETPLIPAHSKTSIHSTWKIGNSSLEKLVLTLFPTTTDGSKIGDSVVIEHFEVAFYKLDSNVAHLAQECPEIVAGISRTENFKYLLDRYSSDFQPALVREIDAKTPGKVYIHPWAFKPNTKYALEFDGRTNFDTSGRVTALVRTPSKFDVSREVYPINIQRWFWKPWWQEYQLEIMTLPTPDVLELNFENREVTQGGKVFYRNISIRELNH